MTTTALVLLAAAVVLQAAFLFRREDRRDPASHYLALAAALLLFGVIIVRSLQINFVALTNTFESLVFYAGFLALLVFFYRVQSKVPFNPFVYFGSLFSALVLLAVAFSPIAPDAVLPPIPALKSFWLVLHVSFSFIGEAFFVVSFVASVVFLLSKDEDRRLACDRITYTSIAVGYPVFTAGALIFGAIWAERAWGRYWSWDPKETWALVTWLVYTAYLHVRLIRRRKDNYAAILAVAGFLCTLFTFFGVNYLLPGLHSYG
jgi:ABC-type transport system involved in cytochrome c biogenesis permease subunit